MHSLPKPSGNRSSVFHDCASRIVQPGRSALLGGIDRVNTGIIEYLLCARDGRFDQLNPHVENGDDNKVNHEKLYDNHFSASAGCHYPTYTKIRSLKSTFRCPYCGFGRMKVVDHFMPKSKFFRYSVYLDNLIPCCRDCNTEKDDYYAPPGEGSIFHPYFDEVPNFKWLYATFTPVPFSVDFSVLETVSPFTRERLANHLIVFDLAENYKELSVNYYTNIKGDLASVCKSTNPFGKNLTTHLSELRDQAFSDCGEDLNYWKVSFLDELIHISSDPELRADLLASLQI